MNLLARIPLFLCLCTALPFLGGCAEQEGKLNVLNEQLNTTREANAAATVELLDLNQKLAVLNRQTSSQSSKRLEFEGKLKTSSNTENLLVKYRTELEASLKQFTEDVAAYRKQHLLP